jgi:glycosyltransferase involved in cell wall biosynthesis
MVLTVRIGLIGHHVAPVAPPFAGGVESMTWYLAQWLANHGHEVTLFANPGSVVPGVDVVALETDRDPGKAARHDVSMPLPEFMRAHRAYQALMLELIRARGRFDVIHSHSLHYLPVLLAELVRTPMVLTLHCPPTPWLEAALADATGGRPVPVAVSKATRELWSSCTPVSRVIRNGIDLGRWRPGPGGDALLWAGRIVREKAPHLAIDAAARTGRAIRLAGPIGDGVYWAAEVQPRLGDRARYLGHLAHDELAPLVGASGALVVTPMWEEPFCLAAAEAMASGTPVVGFARGGLPEVVGERGGVLTTPGDVGSLAAAIRLALDCPRETVRRHAHASLGLDRVGAEYQDLYAELAARTRGISAGTWWRRRSLRLRPRPAPASA